VVTGALERERAQKRIGSGLEAVPDVYIDDPALRDALVGIDMAEICITSGIAFRSEEAPDAAFRLPEVPGVAVLVRRAEELGLVRCARSWRWFDPRTADPEFPGITARDAKAMREYRTRAESLA
jgi:isoleucyl-tRNA synthetase